MQALERLALENQPGGCLADDSKEADAFAAAFDGFDIDRVAATERNGSPASRSGIIRNGLRSIRNRKRKTDYRYSESHGRSRAG